VEGSGHRASGTGRSVLAEAAASGWPWGSKTVAFLYVSGRPPAYTRLRLRRWLEGPPRPAERPRAHMLDGGWPGRGGVMAVGWITLRQRSRRILRVRHPISLPVSATDVFSHTHGDRTVLFCSIIEQCMRQPARRPGIYLPAELTTTPFISKIFSNYSSFSHV